VETPFFKVKIISDTEVHLHPDSPTGGEGPFAIKLREFYQRYHCTFDITDSVLKIHGRTRNKTAGDIISDLKCFFGEKLSFIEEPKPTADS
jgi:hypothetical protein